MHTNRICKICGKAYYYCPSCDNHIGADGRRELWRVMVHDENCRKIMDTLQRHSTKEYSDEQARQILLSCDLSVIGDKATDLIKRQIAAIMDIQPAMPEPEPEVTYRPRKSKTKKVIENN